VNEKLPSIVQRLQGLSSLGKLEQQRRSKPERGGAGTFGARG